MTEPKFRTRFTRPRAKGIEYDASLSRVKPSFKKECDINEIMKRAHQVGQLPPPKHPAQFADVSGVGDYHSSLETVMKAQEKFFALPAALRKECGNSPEVFLEKLKDRKWCEDNGLVQKERPNPLEGSPSPSAKPPGAAKGDADPAHAGKRVAKKAKESDNSDDE